MVEQYDDAFELLCSLPDDCYTNHVLASERSNGILVQTTVRDILIQFPQAITKSVVVAVPKFHKLIAFGPDNELKMYVLEFERTDDETSFTVRVRMAGDVAFDDPRHTVTFFPHKSLNDQRA